MIFQGGTRMAMTRVGESFLLPHQGIVMCTTKYVVPDNG